MTKIDRRICPVAAFGYENKYEMEDGSVWWVCENTGEWEWVS